jgi:hypothetical protein
LAAGSRTGIQREAPSRPRSQLCFLALMHGKDTLALGNMTRAIIFQSTLPATFVVRAVLAMV